MATQPAAPEPVGDHGRSPGRAQPALGEALRMLRRRRGHSLVEVAAATGISQSFLSIVETGQADITISRLMRLVAFYGVSVADLLPALPPRDPLIVRNGEERHLSSPAEGIDVSLLTVDTKRRMMPIIVRFEPGGGEAEYTQHEGEEFVHILSGAIVAEVDGHEPIVLRKGDSVYFRADRKHSYRNDGKSRAVVLAVVTPPTL